MLTEHWRAAHLNRRIRQLYGAADGLIGAARRVVDIDDHLARFQMRVAQHLAGVLAGAARHSGRAENAHDLVLRSSTGPFLDNRIEGSAVLPARLLAGKARVLGKLGPTDRPGEGGPHLLLRGDESVVIRTTRRTGIGRAWNPAPHLVAAPRHGLAKALMVAQAHPDDVDDCILHRYLDMLAFTSRVTLLQRCQDADRHVHAGAAIPNRRHDKGRR